MFMKELKQEKNIAFIQCYDDKSTRKRKRDYIPNKPNQSFLEINLNTANMPPI